MSNETTGNQCPRCGQNKLRIIYNNDGSMNGVCTACGNQVSEQPENYTPQRYSFDIQQIFTLVNKYAFIIAIIAVLCSFSAFASIDSLRTYTITNIDSLSSDITDTTSSITQLQTTLTVNTDNIANTVSSITDIETNMSNLQNDISNIETTTNTSDQTINILNSTISSLQEELYNIENAKEIFSNNSIFTIDINEYTSQNSSLRYADFCITIFNNISNLSYPEFTISFPNTCIEELDRTSQSECICNIDNTSYAKYEFIGSNTNIIVNLRMWWHTSNYNTSIVNTDNLISFLHTNGWYFDFNITKTTV